MDPAKLGCALVFSALFVTLAILSWYLAESAKLMYTCLGILGAGLLFSIWTAVRNRIGAAPPTPPEIKAADAILERMNGMLERAQDSKDPVDFSFLDELVGFGPSVVGHVYDNIKSLLLYRPSPSAVEAAKALCERLGRIGGPVAIEKLSNFGLNIYTVNTDLIRGSVIDALAHIGGTAAADALLKIRRAGFDYEFENAAAEKLRQLGVAEADEQLPWDRLARPEDPELLRRRFKVSQLSLEKPDVQGLAKIVSTFARDKQMALWESVAFDCKELGRWREAAQCYARALKAYYDAWNKFDTGHVPGSQLFEFTEEQFQTAGLSYDKARELRRWMDLAPQADTNVYMTDVHARLIGLFSPEATTSQP